MSGRTIFKAAPPQSVYTTYKQIRESKLMVNKNVEQDSITEFQTLLNQAQPQNDDEKKMRSLIQFLYRRNPTNFCRFFNSFAIKSFNIMD